MFLKLPIFRLRKPVSATCCDGSDRQLSADLRRGSNYLHLWSLIVRFIKYQIDLWSLSDIKYQIDIDLWFSDIKYQIDLDQIWHSLGLRHISVWVGWKWSTVKSCSNFNEIIMNCNDTGNIQLVVNQRAWSKCVRSDITKWVLAFG